MYSASALARLTADNAGPISPGVRASTNFNSIDIEGAEAKIRRFRALRDLTGGEAIQCGYFAFWWQARRRRCVDDQLRRFVGKRDLDGN